MSETHRNALPKGFRLHWYEIESVLGQGGFGITYLARDTNLDHLVAIKEFLPQELSVREGDSSVHPLTDGHADTFKWGLSRFVTEARTLAKFRHPNIVTVHSVFEANQTAYMVMAYEHGRSLLEALRDGHLSGEAQVKSLTWPLLDGLEVMHAEGFIHRDIKPANIYIRDDGTPVLLDFGSARLALGGQTRTLTTLVSPGYAPFEQYESGGESGRQGPWTDIYSLGATLYLAATGKGPPDAVTRANALLEGRADPLVPAATLAPAGFSPAFLGAIDAALAFNASRRPREVSQWRALLQGETPDFSEQPTVLRAEPADRRERTQAPPPPPRSRKGLWWSLAALLLAGLVGGGLFMLERGLLDPAAVTTALAPKETAAPPPAAVMTPPPVPAEVEPAPPAVDEEARAAAEARAREVAEQRAREAERDARVAELLRAASEDAAAGRLTPPATPNALSRYREVLALQPDNGLARAGIGTVLAATAARAREAMAAGDLELAAEHLAQAESIDVDAPSVVEVRALYDVASSAVVAMRDREREQAEAAAAAEAEAAARAAAEEESRRAEAAALAAEAETAAAREEEIRRQIEAERASIEAEARRQVEEEMRRAEEETRRRAELEAERAAEEEARAQAQMEAQQREVDALLAQAQKHTDELRMTGPPGHNALELLQQVMQMQPGNEQAQAGLDHIVEFYVDVAGKAARQGEPVRAADFLDRAALAGPNDPAVAEARSLLAAGRLGARAAPAPTPAPQPEAAPPAPPALPSVAYIGGFCARCGAQFKQDVARAGERVRVAVEAASGSVELHSAPWAGAPAPFADAGDFNRYWTGPRSMGAEPRQRDIARAAKRAGADAALMLLMTELNQTNVTLFLVEAESGRVRQVEGVLRDLSSLTTRLLARWSAGFKRAAAPPTRAPGEALRLGILGQWCVRCGASANSQLARFERGTRDALDRAQGVEVAFSPWGGKRPPARADTDRLWDRAWSLSTLQARAGDLADLARGSGLDGLLVGVVGPGAGSAYEARAFLVNAADGRLHELQAPVGDTAGSVRDLLEDWLAGA